MARGQRVSKETNHKLNLSGALNCHQWKFLPKGVDDFRDGFPASSDTSNVLSSGAHHPILRNAVHDSKPFKKPQKFTIEQSCYSKLLPLQQTRREYIAEIEYGLTQHPLALYPHLEESISPDLFEDVVEILDPDMRLKSSAGSYEVIPEDQEEDIIIPAREEQETHNVKSRETSTRLSTMSDQSRLKNPYTWIVKQEETVKEEKRSKIPRPLTPVPDESVKHVTKDFCDWVTSLGGESCSVNETTIFSLFASGYDTKPTLSVPIHVVELNNVPAELRMSVGVSPQQDITKTSTTRIRSVCQMCEGTYSPTWVKSRYGAWYLDPQTWKKQNANEPLKDPTMENEEKGNHSKNKLSQKDEELLQLHGTSAFKEFIERKGYRRPEFLNKISYTKDAVSSERASRDASSAGKMWYRSGSASTHEESIIN
ncbi:PREDICTED: protein FAM47E-like [Nanorana parkeri]|uniref:protein FAM47E-like n=1 Tax=Nanorana parkeri TaxID=125878 RepID=UPI000854E55E|nr:PREDICTED: protein FAM47E-like [Nanorana parkeri]